MSLRELVVLGTASQVPTRHRNHNGYLLRWDGEGFLFDPGEGTQRQFLYAGVAASAITRILITHFHGDHCLGLASMVQRISLDQVKHPIEVFYPETGQVYFERLIDASIYYKQATIVPRPLPLAESIVDLGRGLTLKALPLEHVVDCLGYQIREADGVRFVPELLVRHGIAGERVGELRDHGEIDIEGRRVKFDEVTESQPGSSFAFVMDTRRCDNAIQLARDVDMLVIESTFLNAEADRAAEYGHLTAREAGEIARVAEVRRLVLTHFSARYLDVTPLVVEASAEFPGALAASDLARFELPRRPRGSRVGGLQVQRTSPG